MKTKKVKGSLKLNKTTIARLDDSEAREVKGGGNPTAYCTLCTPQSSCNV